MAKALLTVRAAKPDEFEQVVQLYNDTARWMIQQGIEQWSYPVAESFRARIEQTITRADVYLAWQGEETKPVGVFRLEWFPNVFWGEVAGKAGYLYSLAVHPGVQGRGVGAELIGWAEAYVRQQGRAYLRLDCKASSEKLRRYYSGLGFHYRGDASADGFSGALFEKRL